MPNPLNVPITPPRVAFIDPRTGTVSREWYMFFLSLFQLTGGSSVSLDDLQKGPPALTVDEINAFVNKAAENLRPSTEGVVEQIAELQKQIEGLQESSESCCADEIAELQKQIQALEVQVRPELGTMSQLQQSLLPWVIWNTTPEGVPPDVGTLAWDGGTTLGVQMTANVIGRVNESGYYYTKASSTITKGQVIMFTGAVGASGVPTGAPATGVTDGSYIMGIAAEDIANNGFGLVQFIGTLRGVDLSAYSDGDILWYNPAVTGGLTKTKPSAPNVKVQVAAVISNSNNGTMLIRVTAGSELGGTDSNVQFSTVANGDLIQYDSALQYWKNVTPASVISGASGAPVTKTANFTVANGETWLINNKSGSSCTVTLPSASTNTGRVLYFLNYQNQTVVSASSNVVPLAGGAATTAILEAVAGANATLVSNGTNWVMTQYDSNNALQLE